LQLVVEVRQLPAGIFQEEFPVDSERGGEQIESQSANEKTHAAATVKEEKLLHSG
jgi:hypothetical protein